MMWHYSDHRKNTHLSVTVNPIDFACIKLLRSLRIALNRGNFIREYKFYYPSNHFQITAVFFTVWHGARFKHVQE